MSNSAYSNEASATTLALDKPLIKNCIIKATGTAAIGVENISGTSIVAYSKIAGDTYDLKRDAGTLYVLRDGYDTTHTSGTITPLDGDLPAGIPASLITGIVPLNHGGTGFDASGVAKGGILAGTGAGALGITTVGTNKQVLEADSGSAGGVKWGPVPHFEHSITYISGTGTAGTDNTAMTVKTITLPANTLTQVNDRLRIRCYFAATAGGPDVGSTKLNTVLVADTSVGGTNLSVTECWIHYIDNTHANIIENEAGALGANSNVNVAGFTWNANQDIIFTQTAVPAQHLVVYAMIVDIYPKGI